MLSGQPPTPANALHELCGRCSGLVTKWLPNCTHCGLDLGAPNVRAAKDPLEKAALEAKYESVFEDHRAHGREYLVTDYRNAVDNDAMAVVSRTAAGLLNAILSEDDISSNYYRSVAAGVRLPRQGHFNKLREILDPAIFPGYHEDIRFAALAFPGKALASYGSCSMWLKTPLISERSSLFDANSLISAIEAGVAVGELDQLPGGHRAEWSDRGKFSAAQLTEILSDRSDFSDALTRAGSGTQNDRFIEVHIWGPFTTWTLDQINIPASPTPDEAIFVDALKELMSNRAIHVGVA